MSANKLHDTIMEQIAAADGLVVVDGRTMVRRAVLRAVVRSVLLEVVDELRDELPLIVADHAEAAASWTPRSTISRGEPRNKLRRDFRRSNDGKVETLTKLAHIAASELLAELSARIAETAADWVSAFGDDGLRPTRPR